MTKIIKRIRWVFAVTLIGALMFAGCGKAKTEASKATVEHTDDDGHDHSKHEDHSGHNH